jgi:tetratricopeptide (TPR) repeat protein
MSKTLKNIIFLIFFTDICFHIGAQDGLLKRQDVLNNIREVLFCIYSYDFGKARDKLQIVRKEIQDHPVTPFMDALILYWEYYPLMPGTAESDDFINLMEQAIDMAEKNVELHPGDPEANFFSLFGKAFYSMYWADNGKPGKVFPYMSSMYRQTIAGMKMKDQFTEFYFTSGLYNYYIDAYPEKHPVYKPVSRLFNRGNKEQGLKELEYCAENATYLRVEARYFLCLLYLSYENDPRKASEYAASLYQEFPKNTCYIGNYAFILLLDKKFPVAEVVIRNLEKNTDSFSRMQVHILNGYLHEKYERDYPSSIQEYELGLQASEEFGDVVHSFRAMALMGIGRHFQREGNTRKADRYFRQAKNITAYDYLLNDKN